jgi:hypothetical protein
MAVYLLVFRSVPLPIRIRRVTVNWDKPVEEMIKWPGFRNDPRITPQNLPDCSGGKTGTTEESDLVLVNLGFGEWLFTDEVLERLDKMGYVPAELPELAPLKARCDEYWGWRRRFWFIAALGPNSAIVGPDGKKRFVALHFSPRGKLARGFRVSELHWCWRGWFLCRRKPEA